MDMLLYVVLPGVVLAAIGYFVVTRNKKNPTTNNDQPQVYLSQTVSETYAQDTNSSSGPSATFFLTKGATASQGVYFTVSTSGGSIGNDSSKVTYPLKEKGVAARHLVVSHENGAFVARSASPELSFVYDGKNVQEATLANGGVLGLGEAELRLKLA